MNYEVIKVHETKIRENMATIQTEISKCEISDDYKTLKNVLDTINDKISETEKEIRQYNIATTINNSSRDNSTFKIKEIEQKLQKYKRQQKKFKEKLNNINSKKNGNNSINENTYDEEYGNSDNTSLKSFNKIQLANRSTIEMENMTGSILENLNNQSEQMKGVNKKIGNMNEDIDSSSGILTKMLGRENRDKRIIILFGLMLSLIVVSVLVYKLIKKFT